MLSYAPSGTGHKDYVADKHGILFDCHYVNDVALLELVESADRLITWVPGSSSIDPSIKRFCDLLNALRIVNRPAGSDPYPSQPFNLTQIRSQREDIARHLKSRPLTGCRLLEYGGLTVLALVFVPLDVFSCSLTARI